MPLKEKENFSSTKIPMISGRIYKSPLYMSVQEMNFFFKGKLSDSLRKLKFSDQ